MKKFLDFIRKSSKKTKRVEKKNYQTVESLFSGLINFKELKNDITKENSQISDQFKFLNFCLENYSASYAQLFQDLFVLHILQEKKNGFFVEFGATDGILLSNSCLLEKKYEWNGILAEPGKNWHAELTKNRNVNIDTRCVWSQSKEKLKFFEAKVAEYSTLGQFTDSKQFQKKGMSAQEYEVETITLTDLLKQYNAPKVIDYLSIDTEGSEFEILSTFDFSSYKFNVITVEHNYSLNRDKLKNLLEKNGYKSVFSILSKWDDWYVHNSLIA